MRRDSGIYEIEDRAIEQLRRSQRASAAMADLFKEHDLSMDYDNWSAISGLLDAALKRFGGRP